MYAARASSPSEPASITPTMRGVRCGATLSQHVAAHNVAAVASQRAFRTRTRRTVGPAVIVAPATRIDSRMSSFEDVNNPISPMTGTRYQPVLIKSTTTEPGQKSSQRLALQRFFAAVLKRFEKLTDGAASFRLVAEHPETNPSRQMDQGMNEPATSCSQPRVSGEHASLGKADEPQRTEEMRQEGRVHQPGRAAGDEERLAKIIAERHVPCTNDGHSPRGMQSTLCSRRQEDDAGSRCSA